MGASLPPHCPLGNLLDVSAPRPVPRLLHHLPFELPPIPRPAAAPLQRWCLLRAFPFWDFWAAGQPVVCSPRPFLELCLPSTPAPAWGSRHLPCPLWGPVGGVHVCSVPPPPPWILCSAGGLSGASLQAPQGCSSTRHHPLQPQACPLVVTGRNPLHCSDQPPGSRDAPFILLPSTDVHAGCKLWLGHLLLGPSCSSCLGPAVLCAPRGHRIVHERGPRAGAHGRGP